MYQAELGARYLFGVDWILSLCGDCNIMYLGRVKLQELPSLPFTHSHRGPQRS